MKIKILSLIIIFMTAIDCVICAQSIAVYFESIPEHILIQIEPNRRKDMIDMFKAGYKASTKTRLGGTAELVEFNEKYLKIDLSKSSTIEMALLGDTTQYIGVIKTVCAPACDSEIEFYTTTWSPINDITVPRPILEDFKYNIDGTGNGPYKPTWDVSPNVGTKNYSANDVAGLSSETKKDDINKKNSDSLFVKEDNNKSVQERRNNRKIEDVVDFVPVKYEFVFNGSKPEETIKASQTLKMMMMKDDLDLIDDQVAPEIFIKINKKD